MSDNHDDLWPDEWAGVDDPRAAARRVVDEEFPDAPEAKKARAVDRIAAIAGAWASLAASVAAESAHPDN